jgi:hypothetical protein
MAVTGMRRNRWIALGSEQRATLHVTGDRDAKQIEYRRRHVDQPWSVGLNPAVAPENTRHEARIDTVIA